jgi:hypothetical protein
VNQHPGLLAAPAPYLDQHVGSTRAQDGITNNLLQLLVQKGVSPVPIDVSMGLGQEEGDEVGEEMLQRFLPWTVVNGCLLGYKNPPPMISPASVAAGSP